MATGKEATLATKTRVSIRLEVGDRLAEPKGGYRIRMARGESESVEVSAELLDGGRPFDAAGLSARFMAVLAGGRHVAMPVPPEGVSGGTLTYTLPSGLGATPGDTRLAVFELSDGEGYRIYTEPFTVSVADGPSPTSAEIGPYVPELDALIAQLKSAIGSAGEATGAADDAAAKAEAAIAEVKATEAKLYPAAENVLVGSDSGTVAHVEDAFEGAALRGITVEGACKQDGTPSPESPVPIEVVENPVVKVTGRNLLDISKVQANVSVPYGLNISVDGDYVIVKGTASGISDGLTVQSFTIGWYADTSLSGKGLSIKLFGAPANATAYGLRTSDETQIAISTRLRNGDNVDWKMQIAVSQNELAEYRPHSSQPLTFALPAEHPYLAKLPDGTADEIVVDQEGNVELVARVAKLVGAKLQSAERASELDNTSGVSVYGLIYNSDFTEYANGVPKSSGAAYCDKLYSAKSGTENVTNAVFKPTSDVFVVNIAGAKDETDAVAIFNALESTIYAPGKETRYPLGKIDMPKAQDTILNAWTDAEVTPNTGIGYVRDVNIVVANLESAIASISK